MSEPFDLATWYRQLGSAVLRRCRRYASSEAEAQDLLQEAFLRAHRYQQSYRGGSRLAWLLTIADRLGYDLVKKRKEPVQLDQLEAFLAAEPGPDLAHAQSVAAVRALVGRVDVRTHQIVVMRFWDELSLDEIARALDVNEKTVRRALLTFMSAAREVLGPSRVAAAPLPVGAGGAHA